MDLDTLRERVAFQNSVDVWIALCSERGSSWDDPDQYRRFTRHLRENDTALRKYSLCVSDADSPDEHERRKAGFAKGLAESQDPDAGTYSIRLDDRTIGIVRAFSGEASG